MPESIIPAWVRWVAVDGDGAVYGYAERPSMRVLHSGEALYSTVEGTLLANPSATEAWYVCLHLPAAGELMPAEVARLLCVPTESDTIH